MKSKESARAKKISTKDTELARTITAVIDPGPAMIGKPKGTNGDSIFRSFLGAPRVSHPNFTKRTPPAIWRENVSRPKKLRRVSPPTATIKRTQVAKSTDLLARDLFCALVSSAVSEVKLANTANGLSVRKMSIIVEITFSSMNILPI